MTSTATLTLADFLLARIAEDEAEARAPRYNMRDHWWLPDYADPARVLAECEAKRRIVEMVKGPLTELAWTASGCSETTDPGDTEVGEKILRNLALPYADHEDYDENWRL